MIGPPSKPSIPNSLRTSRLRNSAMKSAPSSPERVASIDIGTNTILLLIANVGEKGLTPLFEQETIVRLGEGVQKNKVLSQEAMEGGLHNLAFYMEQGRKMGARKV